MPTNALGFCEDRFNPAEPGRLCRGRERWIEAWPDDSLGTLSRLVISGAVFSDDSANDARRGLPFSGLSLGQVLTALFPGQTLHAWAEEAHAALVPDDAAGVEHFSVSRPGGPLQQWAARWTMPCAEPAQMEAAIEAGADVFLALKADHAPDDEPAPIIRPSAPVPEAVPALADAPDPIPPVLGEGMRQRLYLLTGFREGLQPSRRFQPGVLPELLEHVAAVILVHRDKHAPCLGIYTREPVEPHEILKVLCKANASLAVPFAIPPMLARWDRALWELRQEWDSDEDGPFPVEPAPEGVHSWGRRHGRRKKRRRGDADGEE